MNRFARDGGVLVPDSLGNPDDAPDADQIEEMLTADSATAADELDQEPRLDVAPEVAALHLDTRDADEADVLEQSTEIPGDDDEYR